MLTTLRSKRSTSSVSCVLLGRREEKCLVLLLLRKRCSCGKFLKRKVQMLTHHLSKPLASRDFASTSRTSVPSLPSHPRSRSSDKTPCETASTSFDTSPNRKTPCDTGCISSDDLVRHNCRTCVAKTPKVDLALESDTAP